MFILIISLNLPLIVLLLCFRQKFPTSCFPTFCPLHFVRLHFVRQHFVLPTFCLPTFCHVAQAVYEAGVLMSTQTPLSRRKLCWKQTGRGRILAGCTAVSW